MEINKWAWMGTMKVVSKGEECIIRLEDKTTGDNISAFIVYCIYGLYNYLCYSLGELYAWAFFKRQRASSRGASN